MNSIIKEFSAEEFIEIQKKRIAMINFYLENKSMNSLYDSTAMLNEIPHETMRKILFLWEIAKYRRLNNLEVLDFKNPLDTMGVPSQVRFLNTAFGDMDLKILEIDEDLWQLFTVTRTQVFLRKTPFNHMYINHYIELAPNIFAAGFSVTDGIGEDDGKHLMGIQMLGKDFNDNSEFHMEFSIDEDGIYRKDLRYHKEYDDVFPVELTKKMDNKVAMIACNIIDFMNNKDVEYKIIEHPKEMNEKRESKNKLRISTKVVISPTKTLYKYINSIPRGHNEALYCFSVMAHRMHFRDKQKYKKIYMMTENELSLKRYMRRSDGTIYKQINTFYKNKDKPLKPSSTYKLKRKGLNSLNDLK